MKTEEFIIESGTNQVRCTLALPERSSRSKDSGLLVNISATANYALHDPTQNHPTGPFLEAGHYVLSFDLPHHGERVDKFGEGLKGFGKAFLAGDDPFQQFIADGKAAIDRCLEKGIANAGNIVSYGVSRAGYCLLRLAAVDSRVRAVAGLSPVTDWGILEAQFVSPKRLTWPLQISRWVDPLADKAIYLSVGSQDDIVGTQECVQFAMKLFKKQRKALPKDILLNELHVVNSPSHSPGKYWRLDATRFLLDFCHKLTESSGTKS
ncbi:MAG: hypothetical protein MK025_04595 [Acidobacteriia bacterium]|nr:hypothetical protein [Terriglobia bacterium]